MLGFGEGEVGALGGAVLAVGENVVDDVGATLEVGAAVADGGDGADDGIGDPALAFDAADGGGAAASGGFLLDGLGGEDFVKVEDRAEVGVAGVGAADAGRVCDHDLELGADAVVGLGEFDVVLVALGHLAAVEAGELGRWGEQSLRLGEDLAAAEGRDFFGLRGGLEELVGAKVSACGVFGLAGQLAGLFEDGGHLPGSGVGRGEEVAGVEGIEAASDLAGELDVSDLVGADGDKVGLVEEDVGGLEEWVAEEAVGGEILLAELLLLVFVGGDALEPAEGGEHAEEQEELGVGGDVRLLEDDAAAGVQACGEEVEGDLDVVGLNVTWVGVVGGESVKVGDEEVAVVVLLKVNPVVEGSHVVAEVQAAGGTHAGEDAGTGCGAGWIGAHEWKFKDTCPARSPARTARVGLDGARRCIAEGYGLEAEEQRLEDGHDREEEELDDVKAEKEETEHEVEAHALVGFGGVEGEIVHEDLAAVEEGQGNEVEDEEQGVDEDAEVEKEDEGEDAGKAFGADAEVAHGELGGDDEGVNGAGDGVADDDEREEGDDGGEELGGGAGKGGKHLVAGGVAEVARGEGDGLAPAEDERAAEDEQDGPDEGSEEVEVTGGVHGEAAHHAGGGVAEAVGGPGLSAVVERDGEHQDDQLKDDQSNVQRHEDSLRE